MLNPFLSSIGCISSRQEAKSFMFEYAQKLKMENPNLSDSDAFKQVKKNIAYYIGYYDAWTRSKIEYYFKIQPPYISVASEDNPATTLEQFLCYYYKVDIQTYRKNTKLYPMPYVQ